MKMIFFFATLATAMLSISHSHAEESSARDDLDYRAIRKEALGRDHDQMKTPRGTIFYKVKIKRIDDYRITIEHQDGQSILEFGSIPAEWIKEFNLVDRTKSSATSSRSRQPAAPKFDLSGTVSIGGDTQSGVGILVKEGEAYYVYTDCSTISGNTRISIQAKSGKVIEHAKVIECAEGIPLARIQVKISGDEAKHVTLAALRSGDKLQVHQYLYALKNQERSRSIKIKAIKPNTIDLSYRLSTSDKGLAVMTGDKTAIGMILGTMPENQKPSSSNSRRFESSQVNLVRFDVPISWKKIKLIDFMTANAKILAFDEKTHLCKAIGECHLTAGKIVIPSNAETLFKSHSKDRNIADLIKLRDTLEKKSMRVNEKVVERKLNSIIDSSLRSSKKQAEAVSIKAFSWYHRQFFQESASWRKSVLSQIKR